MEEIQSDGEFFSKTFFSIPNRLVKNFINSQNEVMIAGQNYPAKVEMLAGEKDPSFFPIYVDRIFEGPEPVKLQPIRD